MSKTKSIKERIDEITLVLHNISLGDFSQKLELFDKEDKFTDLIVAINLMADNLKELIQEDQRKTSQIKLSREKLRASHKVLKKAKNNIEEEKAKAEALLGSLGEGIIAFDLEGNIILINKEAERMFGKPPNDIIGKSLNKVYKFKNKKDEVIRIDNYPITDVVKNKKRLFTVTYFIRKVSKPLPLATTASPILIGNKIIGVIATFRDITKEQQIDQAKTEFVSLASHQLRTPLTAINWLLEELVRTTDLKKMQKEYAQDAINSNKRMIRLVNDLLNVSRLEAGSISVIPKKVNLINLIKDVIKEFKLQIEKNHQKIKFIQPKTKAIIEVDPQLLRQILSNLISNAIKYSGKNTTVTIKLTKKHKKAIISVKDQGIGIPKDQQHRMFQKFFRTGEAAKRSTTGSGLGMYIVKKITEACNAKISFTSVENKGSEFILTLPSKSPSRKKGIKELIKYEM